MKHYWIITALCISACLSGCSLLGGEAVPNLSRTKSAASKVNAAAPSKTAPVETTFAETSSAETEDEDEDLNTALFRSAAATAQMEITTGLRTMIARRCSTDELRQQAIREGMVTMQENARRLVLEGVTSLNEMQRISVEDQNEQEAWA